MEEPHRKIIRGKLRERLEDYEFFYHVSRYDRLESIKRLGLTPSGGHGMGYTMSVTASVQDRLFLWPEERTAIGWIDSTPGGVLLRFRSEVIPDLRPYEDDNFAQNESSFGRRPVAVYSFGVNATVPASSLESSGYVKKEPGFGDKWFAYAWVPLEQTKGPTKELVRGQLVDRVSAGLPRQKWEEPQRYRRRYSSRYY
jgi:hypothetical protein